MLGLGGVTHPAAHLSVGVPSCWVTVGDVVIRVLRDVRGRNWRSQRLGLGRREAGGGIRHLGEVFRMGVVAFPLNPEGAPELLAFAGLVLQAGVLLAKLGRLSFGIVTRLLELDDYRLEVGDWDGDIGMISGRLGWVMIGKVGGGGDLPASSRVAM